jgi:hypothetical protein
MQYIFPIVIQLFYDIEEKEWVDRGFHIPSSFIVSGSVR